MILIDFSPIVVATVASDPSATESDCRFMVLERIQSINKKFGSMYGDIILCIDDKKSWRKDFFPFYKVKRKEVKANAPFDWGIVEKMKDQLKEEFSQHLPYKTIHVPNAEADDVIAAIVHHSQEPKPDAMFSDERESVLIVSRDKDFGALQYFTNVQQFDPITWAKITIKNPMEHLAELIIRGDDSDSIPNIRSQNDCFAMKIKQKPITKQFLEETMPIVLSGETIPEEYHQNYVRNKTLIDLIDCVPEFVTKSVKEQLNAPIPGRGKLMGYLIKYQMKRLADNINLF